MKIRQRYAFCPKQWLALALLAPLCSCATTSNAPDTRALLIGDRAQESNPDEYDVLIVAVDGRMTFAEEQSRLQLESGFHYLNVATTKQFREREQVQQPFAIEVKRCMRYYLVAQHDSRVSKSAWRVVVKKAEANESCLAGKR